MGTFFKLIFGAMAGPIFMVVTILLFVQIMKIVNIDISPIVSVMIALTPIWLPIGLFYITYDRWMWYKQSEFATNAGRYTLRLHLPQEVFKSPEAMEAVFAQIHNTNSPSNLMESYLGGKHPMLYSFELVSTGGELKFYINVPSKRTKNSVEAQLYAYYPGIEVTEEKLDYADEITWDPEKYEYMSFHMGKKADDFFPIKTYIDWGMDKLPKEEEKFEPMAAMLEQLSSIKPHERLWVQFLARPHTKKNINNGLSLKEVPTWDTRAIAKINEMLKRDLREPADPEEQQERAPMLTMGERDTIAAIERNIGKYAYEVAVRWMYITEIGKFNGDVISPTLRSFAQYDVINRNGIVFQWRTDFDYNWLSDRSGKRRLNYKKRELRDYKMRHYNYDLKTKVDYPKVFSVEELATIYHIPGSSVVTPSMPRITSTRKEAPANLPTGLARPI